MAERSRDYVAFIPEELVKRITKEITREKFVTPYMLAERYNMTVSLARKLLRRLEKEGLVKLHAPSRRAPIYIITSNQ